MNEILLNILVTVLIPAIGAALVYGVKFGWSFLKLKLANTRLAVVTDWIEKLVAAAEQKWNESGSGETKKSFVTGAIKNILSTLKITCFSDDEIDALIEAAVQQLNTVADSVLDIITADTGTTEPKDTAETAVTSTTDTATTA